MDNKGVGSLQPRQAISKMVQVVDRRENNEAAFSRPVVFGVTYG